MHAVLLFLALAAPPLTEGLTLYLPADGNAVPAYAYGRRTATSPAVEYPGGRAGGAVRLGAGMPPLRVPAAGNFNPARGTVAFWVRPEWTPLDRGPDAPDGRVLFSASRFRVMWQKGPDVLFFMTGDVVRPQDGYQWDYGVAKRITWPRGEWRHVAVTWDKATGAKRIYVDGAVVAEGKTDRITGGVPGGEETIELGSPAAPGDYDELAIWDRPLDAADLRRLATDPAGAARELASKAPRPAEPAWPVRLGLVMLAPQETIVAPGETKELVIPVASTGAAYDGRLELVLRDVFGQALATQTCAVHVSAGGRTTLPTRWSTTRLGVFKVEATLDGRWRRDVGGFAVWPVPEPAPADSFFGAHIEQGGDFVAQAARLGQNWARGHNLLQATWWARVQPEPGAFDWGIERILRKYQAAGIHVLGQFFAAPYWATDPPEPKPDSPWAYPRGGVPRADALAAYVSAVVTRYRDWVHDWETWNEPEVSLFWRGTPAQYANLCRICYTAAKAADPTCRVFVGGFTGADYGWHEAAAKAGALRAADGVSFHVYPTVDQPAESILTEVEHFRDLARRYGAGDAMPLWSTEGGVADTSFYGGLDLDELPPAHLRRPPNYLRGAARAVQGAVLLLSAGVGKHFYYLQKPPSPAEAYEGTQSLELTGVPRPKLMARRALARELDGARYVRAVALPRGGVAYLFRRAAGSVAVAWCADGRQATWSPPAGATVLDLMGNPVDAPPPVLTDVPLTVRSPGSAEELGAALAR